MVGEFEARDNGLKDDSQKLQMIKELLKVEEEVYLTNQQAFALRAPSSVWQQKACFVLSSLYKPLDLLTSMDVMSNHKGFNPGLPSFFLLVHMYDDIASSSTMQGMNRPAFVSMEMPCRTRGCQEIVNGCTGRSS